MAMMMKQFEPEQVRPLFTSMQEQLGVTHTTMLATAVSAGRTTGSTLTANTSVLVVEN